MAPNTLYFFSIDAKFRAIRDNVVSQKVFREWLLDLLSLWMNQLGGSFPFILQAPFTRISKDSALSVSERLHSCKNY